MKRFLVNSVYTLLIILLTFGVSVAAADSAVPATQRPGQQGLFKAAQMSKASTPLVRVLSEYRAHVNQGRKTDFKPSDRFLLYNAGRVLIDARATAGGEALLDDLNQLGLMNGAIYKDLVSGLLPVAAMDQAVVLPSLRSVSAAIAPIRNVGNVTSQGDIALRVIEGRSTYGVDGTGVTVGILSDSFDTLGGAAADVASGDLPAGVQVIGGESPYCGTLIFCIDEGRAMAQIVYDMAPGVDILFHTGFATKADYAAGIMALAAADVIVDDLLYLNEPMFQDGVVAQAVDSVTAAGVAYYSAAGNAGDESYEAAFIDSGEIFCIEFFLPIGDCDPIYERVGRMHDFDPGPGVDLYQSVTVPLDGVLTVALQWDEPFGGAGPNGARNDHDIVLLDQTGGIYYEISANDNVVSGEGWEVLQFINYDFMGYGTSFNLIITYDDVDSIDPPASFLKMVVFGSGNSLNEFQTNSATLFGHANAAGAEAVGAAFFEDTPEYLTDPPLLEPYSSRGGTPILFTSNGAPLGAPIIRSKPEITAVDGVQTTFFFNDSHGNDGIDDFFGTSAAAPHAAGIAALMLEAQPGSTPQQINAALENSAIDMNTAGFDHDSGYGLIQADAAITDLLDGGGNAPPVAGFSFSSNDLEVTFTDTSDDLGGYIVAWSWDFGDGNNASVQDPPTHTYAADGTYTVTLTVTDDDDAIDSTSQSVTVTVPDTTAPTITSPADVSVEATAVTTPVTLGTPTVSDDIDPSPSVSVDNSGPYQVGETVVTWTATDASDNSASATQLVTVNDTTAPSITEPADVTVDATGAMTDVDLGSPVVSDIADPSPSASANNLGPFPFGTTVVTWTAMDASGNSAIATQSVTVNAPASNSPPIASFSYSCKKEVCTFTDASSDSDGTITGWSWNFGDGSANYLSQTPLPYIYTYGSVNTYIVTLTVTDDDGDSNSANTTIVLSNSKKPVKGSTGGGDPGGDTGGSEKGRKKCNDGIDNDGDGLIDGADPDC